MAVAYVLGAFPMAGWLGRRRGIDIYSAGTGLAGAANVMRSVGRIEGVLVLLWDLTKGGLAVLAGWWMGADGAQVLFPVGAVLMGHWGSVFSGFRGGDGMGTLGGCIIALFPVTGIVAVFVAMLVALGGQRMPYPSLLGIVFGYGTLAVLNLTPELDLRPGRRHGVDRRNRRIRRTGARAGHPRPHQETGLRRHGSARRLGTALPRTRVSGRRHRRRYPRRRRWSS